MTVYAELLKLALTGEESSEATVEQLVTEALERRDRLAAPGDAASRLAAALAYDTILVRLCRQLGVENDLLGDQAGPPARRRTERALASVLPVLEGVIR